MPNEIQFFQSVKELHDYLSSNNQRKPDFFSTAFGQVFNSGVSVNLCNFYSQLIREAGRCNEYACDLLIYIDSFRKMLEDYKFDSKGEFPATALGFYKNGVDDFNWFNFRCGGKRYNIHKEYFSVYVIYAVRKNDPAFIEFYCAGYHV